MDFVFSFTSAVLAGSAPGISPRFFVTLRVVPLVAVVVEHSRVVHKRVSYVNNIFVGNCPPSVFRKLLDLLDPLHQFLEQSVRVPLL